MECQKKFTKKCQITGCNKKATVWREELTDYNAHKGYCFGDWDRLSISFKKEVKKTELL